MADAHALVWSEHEFGWADAAILECTRLGRVPLLAYFALRRYLQAVHVVHPIMFALISANLVNLVGDWALIYGHLGFPAMGIVGSGWSTSVARLYMASVLLLTVLYVESKRGLRSWIREARIDLKRVQALLSLGHACRDPDIDGDWRLLGSDSLVR